MSDDPVVMQHSRVSFKIEDINQQLIIGLWGDGNHSEITVSFLTAEDCKKLAKMFREYASQLSRPEMRA